MSPLELIKYPTDLIQRAVRAERLAAANRDLELSKGWSSLATTCRIMARRRPDGGRTQIIDKQVGKKRWVRLSAHPGRPVITWTELRLLAQADGYVMVRADGGVPTIMDEAEWDDLPTVLPAS